MNKGKRMPVSTRIVWICALVLTMTAVISVPLAVSKYEAFGEGTAKARIAKWVPDVSSNWSDRNWNVRALFFDKRAATATLRPANKSSSSKPAISDGTLSGWLINDQNEVAARYEVGLRRQFANKFVTTDLMVNAPKAATHAGSTGGGSFIEKTNVPAGVAATARNPDGWGLYDYIMAPVTGAPYWNDYYHAGKTGAPEFKKTWEPAEQEYLTLKLADGTPVPIADQQYYEKIDFGVYVQQAD